MKKVKHPKPITSFRIPITTLYLPRPGKLTSKEKKTPMRGIYPLHFEPKLKRFVGTKDYLHLFSGWSKTGLRVDLRQALKPHIVADAHNLPFKDDSFPGVVADPPYSDKFAKDLYDTPKLHEKKWISEMVRVCQPGGKIAIYHNYVFARPKGCSFAHIVVTLLRIRHFTRILTVFRKHGYSQPTIEHFCD